MTYKKDAVVKSEIVGQIAGVIEVEKGMDCTRYFIRTSTGDRDRNDLVEFIKACAGPWPVHITVERFRVELQERKSQRD